MGEKEWFVPVLCFHELTDNPGGQLWQKVWLPFVDEETEPQSQHPIKGELRHRLAPSWPRVPTEYLYYLPGKQNQYIYTSDTDIWRNTYFKDWLMGLQRPRSPYKGIVSVVNTRAREPTVQVPGQV